MKITKVGKRGVLFTFNELNKPPFNCVTTVYVIVGNKNYIVCDTYLGDYYMQQIKKYLHKNYGAKNYIAFNSHSHWDHIWGNKTFENNKIIAHSLCKENIIIEGEESLINHQDFIKEEVEIVLPNVIFNDSYSIPEEQVTFFYSPGHSNDSSSCFDKINDTLFVGDNIDDPFPSFMYWNNLSKYIETLQNYLSYNAQYIVQSHGPVTSNEVLKSGIEYLIKLKNNEEMSFKDPVQQHKHLNNLKSLEYLNNN